MKDGGVAVAAAAAPSIGPAIVTIAGTDVPVMALALSVLGLLLARVIAPPPLRKLSRWQEWALTAILLLVLFLIVTGQIGTGRPLGAGMATMTGIGMGFSGLLFIEFFSERAFAAIKAMFGMRDKQ